MAGLVTADYAVREPGNTLLALRPDLVFTPDLARRRPGYVVEDPLRGKFFRVGTAEFTFLSLLDGATPVSRAGGLAASHLNRDALSEQDALALCRWLVDSQLASTPQSATASRLHATRETNQRRRMYSLLNPLCIRIPLVNPDRALSAMHRVLAGFFSWPCVLLWCVLCASAAYIVATDWSHFAAAPAVVLDRNNWLCLAAVWLGLKVLHETFHGLACKHYGGSVPEAGVMLLLLAPAAYVEVTSSWRFTSKWQRIVVAAAGMYVELLAAALAVVGWKCSPPGTLHWLCFDVAIMAGLQTLLFNGNPLLRFDGYFILADALEIPNLQGQGRQYLGYLWERYVLGWDSLLPERPLRERLWIQLYGLAAPLYRALLSIVLAATFIAVFAHLGMLLAAGMLFFWHVLPGAMGVRSLLRHRAGHTTRAGHLAVAAAVALAVIGLAIFMLLRPATVTAPAAVDYSPLTVIRTESPGFVRTVCVHNGDYVPAGQILVALENDELRQSLAGLRLAARQSLIRGRMYFQDGQLAKYQAEQAQGESLRKKEREVQTQVDALTVRAPTAGHVIGRNLESLPGQYLATGAEIVMLGREDAKELTVAIAQDDLDPFLAQRGRPVAVRIRGAASEELLSPLAKVDPRAALALPHPALGSNVGGPLPLRVQTDRENAAERASLTYQLLAPRFTGTVFLSAAQSNALHAGQVATVQFVAASETTGRRCWKAFDRWIERLQVNAVGSRNGSDAHTR